MDFVIERIPPNSRASKCDGPLERHLPEAAVMLAVTWWLFKQGAVRVSIYPDGMHVRDFDLANWSWVAARPSRVCFAGQDA